MREKVERLVEQYNQSKDSVQKIDYFEQIKRHPAVMSGYLHVEFEAGTLVLYENIGPSEFKSSKLMI